MFDSPELYQALVLNTTVLYYSFTAKMMPSDKNLIWQEIKAIQLVNEALAAQRDSEAPADSTILAIALLATIQVCKLPMTPIPK